MNKVFFTRCGALLGMAAFAAMGGTAFAQTTVESNEVKPTKVVVRTAVGQDTKGGTEEKTTVVQKKSMINVVRLHNHTNNAPARTLLIEKTIENGKEKVLVNGKEITANDGELSAEVQKEIERVEAEMEQQDAALDGDETHRQVFRWKMGQGEDGARQEWVSVVEESTENAPDTEGNPKVFRFHTLGKENGNTPTSVTVKRVMENGKEQVFINGEKIDLNATELPEGVEKMLENMSIEIGDQSDAMVFVQSEGDAPSAPNTTIIVPPVPHTAPNHVPKARFFRLGDKSCNMMFTLDTAGREAYCKKMKEMCEKMNVKCKEMKTKCKEIDVQWKVQWEELFKDNAAGIFVRNNTSTTDGDAEDEVSNEVVIQRFDTDDLDEIKELLVEPEGLLGADRHYQVIVIERKSCATDSKAKEPNEQREETPVAVEQHSMEKTSVEPVQPNEIDMQTEYFNVFPNPTQGMLHVSVSLVQSGDVTLTVTDVLGNEVYNERINNYEAKRQLYRQVNLTEKAKGMYFVRVESNGQSFTRQVAVQ